MSEKIRIVDSHCHLNYDGLRENLPEVLAAARERNVTTLLAINTRLAEFEELNAIAEANAGVFCTAGIHPHEAGKEPAVAEELVKRAKLPKVVGLGETGLDYHYDNAPRDAQQRNFRVHVEAARAAGLPVVVHTREAEDDTYAILNEGAGQVTGVLHCFTSSVALAKKCMDIGYYVSFSGIVTFKNAEGVREAAKMVPDERLLVETDAPYLAPIPHRGRPCQPAYVADTLDFLAGLRGVSPEHLAEVTTRNFFALFAKAAP
jgi:TatD DNase family protein